MTVHPKTHPFHMVNPSLWPLLTSVSALFWAVGMILWGRDIGLTFGQDHLPVGLWTLIAGSGMLFLSAYGWWRDVVNESMTPDHTQAVKSGLRYGMVLFILSELFFFGAFFWAYFSAGLEPTEAIGRVWPPEGMKTFHPADIPFFNTLLLLLSGTTITWAHAHLLDGAIEKAARMTAITVALGLFFTAMQGIEYAHCPFSIGDNIYASVFFIATGFHGIHVIVGTIFLGVCYLRLRKGHFTPTDHFGFEAAAWYWHFVDVVWLFVFISIYCWGRAS